MKHADGVQAAIQKRAKTGVVGRVGGMLVREGIANGINGDLAGHCTRIAGHNRSIGNPCPVTASVIESQRSSRIQIACMSKAAWKSLPTHRMTRAECVAGISRRGRRLGRAGGREHVQQVTANEQTDERFCAGDGEFAIDAGPAISTGLNSNRRPPHIR